MACVHTDPLLQGGVSLPDTRTMVNDIKLKRSLMRERYVESQRHTIQVDWIPYMDELAEQCGVKPDVCKCEYCGAIFCQGMFCLLLIS